MSRGATLFATAALLASGVARGAAAQERPGKRIANVVRVSLEEYAKGIDSTGRLTSKDEFDEAVTFLGDARDVAARLSGDSALAAQVALDSLIAAVTRRVPPRALDAYRDRILVALGADASLDLPSHPVDAAQGAAIFAARCAMCHGPAGAGDGPLAASIHPPPVALGSAAAMRGVTPALMFRIVSVGVAGTQMAGFADSLSTDERWSVVAYVNSLRAPGVPAEGEGLYMQRCAVCHGPTGGSNGPLTAALSRLPVEISSFAWQAERSDSALAAAIRDGVNGSAMPPARELTDADVARLVSWVRVLALRDPTLSADAAAGSDPVRVARASIALLDAGLVAVRSGNRSDASDRATDAYLAFEPLETPARARSPGLVSTMERHFADFKGAVRSGDVRAAERSRNAIEEGMPDVLALTRPPGGGWSAFFESLLIILREGFEAILVIGAVVAFLLRTGHRERLRAIWLGVAAAVVASALTAVVLATVLRALPASREIIEGVTMLIAVGVLFMVSYWLISKVEAARWQQFIREKVSAALDQGGGSALAFVAFLAVYREGAETALFYQALFQGGSSAALPIAAGIAVGGAALAVIFTLFHRYGARIPLRPFFGVTSILLYYMAFVFLGSGIRELQEGNVLPITVLPDWPHVEAMGIYPSVETLLAQFVLLMLFVFALLKTFWPRRAVALPTVPPSVIPSATAGDLTPLREHLQRLEERLDAVEQAVADSERADSGVYRPR